MRLAWRIARVAGIDIYIHLTFLLLLLVVAGPYWGIPGAFGKMLNAVLFTCLVFFIITLHELAHALTARRFGINTYDIVLLPIGGLARMERIPERPAEEFLVAIAGPTLNLLLAFALYVAAKLLGFSLTPEEDWSRTSLLAKIFYANVIIAVFNLLPAFPMDGGRLLRSLLASRIDHLRATEIATNVGQALAFILIAIGIVAKNLALIAIGIFVIAGAEQELRYVRRRVSLGGVPVQNVMVRRFHTLKPEDKLKDAVDLILEGFQTDFPVMCNGEVVGIVTRDRILRALAQWGDEVPIRDVMHTRFCRAHPSDSTEELLAQLQEEVCRTIAVIEEGKIVGLITPESLTDFLAIQEARRASQAKPQKG